MNKPKTCSDCTAFQAGAGLGAGWCYLSPPTVLLAGINPPALAGGKPQPVTLSARPIVQTNDRACAMFQGEFEHGGLRSGWRE